MRICSPQLGLSPKSTLGGEVFDREILLGIAKKEIEVEIILPKGKPHDADIRNWKVTYLAFAHFPPQVFNLLIIPYLFKINSRAKIDIIRLHQPQFMGLGTLIFKLIHPQVKTVATYHKFEETNFGPFSKIVNNLWNHIVCDSQAAKQKLVNRFNILPSKISMVHNGVPSYLKPEPKDKNLVRKLKLEGKIVLLFLGLFIERKNPLFLLDVLERISKSRQDIVLMFWGAGPLKEQIVKRAKELGLTDKIRIIDPVFGKGKNKIHNLADVFVHPSTDEGFALAPLEAMACGKPVVMTNAYSASEAVEHGLNGFLCSNNQEEWLDSLLKLIELPILREKMGKAAVQKVKKEFQWEMSVKKHIEIFKSLIGQELHEKQ